MQVTPANIPPATVPAITAEMCVCMTLKLSQLAMGMRVLLALMPSNKLTAPCSAFDKEVRQSSFDVGLLLLRPQGLYITK